MKKVLALVLAVIMVCTMAMAVTIVNVKPGSGNEVSKIVLDKTEEYDFANGKFAVQVPEALFNAVKGTATETDLSKLYSVTGLNGFFATTEEVEGGATGYYVTVPVADKAIDGKADVNFGTFTITNKLLKGYSITVTAKDGKYTVTELKKDGVPQGKEAMAAITVDFAPAYDIGYEPATSFNWETGWYKTGNEALKVSDNGVTIEVPAKTIFKYTKADGAIKESTFKKDKNENVNEITIVGGTVTAGNLTVKVGGGLNDLYYGVDKDGTLYNTTLKFVVETDEDTGVSEGYWTVSGTSLQSQVKVVAAEKSVAAAPAGTTTGTTGTTTNPGTGANDVVGVAAALAVVALVSGAAISLKK